MNSVDKALLITAKFEGGRGYSNVAGNFDGAGLSFGLYQWNAKSETLQPILRQCLKHMPETVEAIFTPEGKKELEAALKTDYGFFKWTLSKNVNKRIIDPWYTRFYKLGMTEGCKKFQRQAREPYIRDAAGIFNKYEFTTERAFALCFDIAIQNGSVTKTAAALYEAANKNSLNEKTKLLNLAQAVIGASLNTRINFIGNKPWTIRDAVRARKLAIVHGTGFVNGGKVDLAKEFGLSDNPATFGEYASLWT